MATCGKVTSRISVDIDVVTGILLKKSNNGGVGVGKIPWLTGVVFILHSIDLNWFATSQMHIIFDAETTKSHCICVWKNETIE